MAVLAGSLPAMAAAGRPDPPNWSDEFAGSALDLTIWGHRATGERWNAILTPDAVTVGDGALTIATYTDAGKHYSGMISTQGGSVGFEQAYGYFEARMKFRSPGCPTHEQCAPTLLTPRADRVSILSVCARSITSTSS
ncbi:MAG: hypothetical protein M3376_10110 [Actinomycetota bacterium]|nr:hypothetical protein [Actinomycetota bacterium]